MMNNKSTVDNLIQTSRSDDESQIKISYFKELKVKLESDKLVQQMLDSFRKIEVAF